MASLGDLGRVRVVVEEATSFGWFGSEIRVRQTISELLMMDFAEKASNMDENSMEAMTFLKDQLRMVIVAEDFEDFWRLGIENGQSAEDVMNVYAKIVEAATDRPTVLPAASSAGQPQTVTSLRDVSSFRDTQPALVSPLQASDLRAVASLDHRPDLVMAHIAAAEARQAG